MAENGPRTDRSEQMDDHARIWALERDMDQNVRAMHEALGELRDKVRAFNRIGVSILVSVCGALILLVVQIATGR